MSNDPVTKAPNWLETDEYDEIRDSLKACCAFIVTAKHDDKTYWKWAFIALHNAIQGCMVVALTHSDRTGALRPKWEKKWREAWETNGDLPAEREKLLEFPQLFEKIQQPGSLEMTSVSHYDSDEIHDAAMAKLNRIRNDFIHYIPGGWYLNLSRADAFVCKCLDVPAFLVRHCGRFGLFGNSKEGELADLIQALRKECEP